MAQPIQIIANAASQTLTYVDKKSKSYSITKFDDFINNRVPSKVVDTGRTTRYLNHRCRHYIVTEFLVPSHPTHFDVLATEDIVVNGPSWILLTVGSVAAMKIKGVPLSVVYSSGPADNVTSLEETPLPASVVEVPAGYKKSSEWSLGAIH